MNEQASSDRTDPVVSVLMPTRNSARTLRQALDALVACELVKEILIADGGSTDQTLEIIRAYDPERVRLLSEKDKGLYDGVNKLMPFIRGDYVVFMNSDDVASCTYIREAVRLLSESRGDYVFGDIVYGAELRRPRFEVPPAVFKACQLMPFPHVSLVMGTPLFKAIGDFDPRYKIAADLDFINRLMARSNRGVYLRMAAATCAADVLSSGNKQVRESWHVAVRHGRHPLKAAATALAVYVYRSCVLPLRRGLSAGEQPTQP
jgi:glycosyltransferase involved in cell wall biosynthesis